MTGDLINGKPRAFWEGMAYFLAKEKNRHLKDITDIEMDLEDLQELGIEIPDPDPGEFISVPKKEKNGDAPTP